MPEDLADPLNDMMDLQGPLFFLFFLFFRILRHLDSVHSTHPFVSNEPERTRCRRELAYQTGISSRYPMTRDGRA